LTDSWKIEDMEKNCNNQEKKKVGSCSVLAKEIMAKGRVQ